VIVPRRPEEALPEDRARLPQRAEVIRAIEEGRCYAQADPRLLDETLVLLTREGHGEMVTGRATRASFPAARGVEVQYIGVSPIRACHWAHQIPSSAPVSMENRFPLRELRTSLRW
jgi:hypothetical protein